MTKLQDDLEAVRVVVDTLQGFDSNVQERIIRWAREKLGLITSSPLRPDPKDKEQPLDQDRNPSENDSGSDIKTFIASKNPKSDVQFAVSVTYFYKFETSLETKKDEIGSGDLQDACRLVGRARLKDPGQTLRDAHKAGYLDKGSERGKYSINTVGENLVAMALPATATKK